eukprot:1722356-Alexandrium_andersonii.AAC.2
MSWLAGVEGPKARAQTQSHHSLSGRWPARLASAGASVRQCVCACVRVCVRVCVCACCLLYTSPSPRD